MPYGIPESEGGESPENIKRMEKCISGVMEDGKTDEGNAIAICKKQLFGSKKNNEYAGMRTFFAFQASETTLKSGDMVKVQIMKVGKWDHQMYGEFEITLEDLKKFKKNFDNDKRGVELYVDENHEDNHRALGWFRELKIVNNDSLYANIELTALGADLLNQGAYKYFSPEFYFEWYDEESRKTIENLLVGGAFTNTPFFKQMEEISVLANETSSKPKKNDAENGKIYNQILFFKDINMDKVKEFGSFLLSLHVKDEVEKSDQEKLTSMFNELEEKDQKRFNEKYNEALKKFDEEAGEEEKPEELEEDKKDGEEKPEEEKPEEDKPEDKEENENENEKPEEKEEEKVDEGSEEKPEEKVEASEKNIKVSAKEFAEMKATISKLENEAKRNEMTNKIGKMVFSEANKEGRLLPKHQNKILELAMQMSEKQCVILFEFIESLPKYNFSEIGIEGNKEKLGVIELVKEETKKFMEANTKLSYGDALKKLFSENPKIAEEYRAARLEQAKNNK